MRGLIAVCAMIVVPGLIALLIVPSFQPAFGPHEIFVPQRVHVVELEPPDSEFSRYSGSCVGFGSSVEFRETVKNPLGEGGIDNSIFTLGDVTKGDGPDVTRDEDSYIRR